MNMKKYNQLLNKYRRKAVLLLKRLRLWLRRFWQRILKIVRKVYTYIKKRITTWWQIALMIIFCVVFLYYPFGGLLTHKIDTSSYQSQNQNNNLFVIDSMSYLINREVHTHIWTPNLPFLFPSYFLDNMPNFQMGIISAVSRTATGLSKIYYTVAGDKTLPHLEEAAKLLRYPPDIWLVSNQNHLLPATSSNTQYKKGRRQLNNFNRELASGRILLPHDARNFATILSAINRDLAQLINTISAQIREHSTDWFDFKADDTFYYAYGKLYAYLQITKALSNDFKDTLVQYEIYSQWTSLISLLEQAITIKPAIVRNSTLNSVFAPNHLAYLSNQAAQAGNYLNVIIYQLQSK